MTLKDTPRFKAFLQGVKCSCGEPHPGLFPINVLVPLGWPGDKTYEPDEALRMEGNFLSENYCVLDGKYFVLRMRLPLAIQGAEPYAFMFTVWASLNQADFEGYIEAKKTGKLSNKASAPARLVNRLNSFPNTFNLFGAAFQQEDGWIPLLLIGGPQPENDANHPLIGQQRNGITFDRALDLFAEYGHDMRASLPPA